MEDAITVIRRKIALRQQHIAKLEQEVSLDKAAIGVLMEILQDIQGDTVGVDTGQNRTISIVDTVSAVDSMSIDTGRALREGSLNDVARSVLREIQESLSANDLFEKVKQKQPDAKQASLLSGIYALARKGRIFVLRNNKIGLWEWENRSEDVTTN